MSPDDVVQRRRYLEHAVMGCRLIVCTLVGGFGCLDGPDASAIHHPQAKYLARRLEPTHRVVLGKRTLLPDGARLVLDSVDRADSIGALDSPSYEVFGHVQNLAVGDGDRLFVLEQRTSEVRIFGTTGALVQVLGRAGRGPGEFANPLSMALDGTGNLLVGDLTRRIHVFRRTQAGFEYFRSIPVAVSAKQMCVMGDKLFIHGVRLDDDRVIYEYDLQGDLLRSFGVVYKSPTPIINFTLAPGLLACIPQSDLLVFAPVSGIGEVYAYDTTGSIRWVTAIDGFIPTDVVETRDGFKSQIPEAGFHSVRTLTPMGSGAILLQLAYLTREAFARGDSYATLESFVLTSSDGRAAYIGTSVPPVVGVGSGYRVVLEEDPFPLIIVQHVTNHTQH